MCAPNSVNTERMNWAETRALYRYCKKINIYFFHMGFYILHKSISFCNFGIDWIKILRYFS